MHSCTDVQVNWPIQASNIAIGRTTRMKRQSLQQIRISPFYITANISAEILNILQADDGPIAYTLNYFQRTLSVVPFLENIVAPAGATQCGNHAVIPEDHIAPSGTGVANADYLYYITAVNDGKN